MAPGRAQRPGAARPDPGCPFCEGHEAETPPEAFAIADGERERDTPGWRVRVVPNLYPAFERQEVVVHTPEHVESFADLPAKRLPLIAAAWRARASAAREAGFAYVHALVNEGREAGASRPHSHSQLVWLRDRPPAVALERPEAVGDLLARSDVIVADRNGVAAVVHPAGRVPYEALIAPREPGVDAWSDGEQLAAALDLLADVVRRLRDVEGTFAWNAWLHNGAHWHLELVPRLSVLAGIELGAGIYVNTMPPERAAAALREAG